MHVGPDAMLLAGTYERFLFGFQLHLSDHKQVRALRSALQPARKRQAAPGGSVTDRASGIACLQAEQSRLVRTCTYAAHQVLAEQAAPLPRV